MVFWEEEETGGPGHEGPLPEAGHQEGFGGMVSGPGSSPALWAQSLCDFLIFIF